jgi:hypothetical protein
MLPMCEVCYKKRAIKYVDTILSWTSSSLAMCNDCVAKQNPVTKEVCAKDEMVNKKPASNEDVPF